MSKPGRPGSSQERGASAVEFALLAPLFLTIVFGIIYGGLAFDRNNMIIHSSREAVRYAATLPISGSGGVPNSWFDEVASVAVGSAAGRLDPVVTSRTMCIAYIGFAPVGGSSADWTRVRRDVGTTSTYSAASINDPTSWCFDDGRGTDGQERRVQVVTGRETDFYVFVFSTTLPLSSDAVARFEPVT